MQLIQLALLALPLAAVQARPQSDQDRQLSASPESNYPASTPIATLERRRKPAPLSMRTTLSTEPTAQASGAAFKTSKTALLPSIIPPGGASGNPTKPTTTRSRRPPRSVASRHHFPSGLSRVFVPEAPPHPTFDLNRAPKPTKKTGGPVAAKDPFPATSKGHGKPDLQCGEPGHHPCGGV